MDFDNMADNEDQLYRDMLEDEQKNSQDSPRPPQKSGNNYDDESMDDYR